MRDMFEDIFSRDPPDPVEAARRAMRPPLRRRFYDNAQVEAAAGGFRVTLDGKPVRTPARHALAVPTRALAEALAAEWRAQAEFIDPAGMPLTRLANSIVDGVIADPAAVAAGIARYFASDLVCYRADQPQALVTRQAQAWDPVVAFARAAFGARFVLAQGVTFVTQPEGALQAARAALPRDPWALGALASATALTGSALIALALLHGALTLERAWAAAHVDEDWNMETWGRDAFALERRERRFAEMRAAADMLRLLGQV
jgi:chaperone required for assembly of F1-ATPase